MLFNKILIAVDNSPFSLYAAKKGFALAHQLNASVGIVSVIDKSKEVFNTDLGITPEQSSTVLLKQAEEIIEQLIKLYDGIGEVFRFTPEGFPKAEILNIINEWEPDLVIMGSHGHSGLQHLLMGSVTEYIIKHTDVPVMVCHKKKQVN